MAVEEPRVIRRANILNCLHLGYASSAIAQILNIDPKTVTNVGNAYLEGGLDSALYDEERSGRPIDFDDRERSRIVAMVCSKPPRGFYRWTLDLIVEEAQKLQLVDGQISRETERVILQEHDLCAVDPNAGLYINKVTECRDGPEFPIFMTEVAGRYELARKIVLLMDNLSTRSCEILKAHMGEDLARKLSNRFEIHYTPKHASWLNQTEIAIGVYSRQCLGDGRVGDIQSLKKQTAAWNKVANKKRPAALTSRAHGDLLRAVKPKQHSRDGLRRRRGSACEDTHRIRTESAIEAITAARMTH